MEVQAVAGAAGIVMGGVSAAVLAPVAIDWWERVSKSAEVRMRVRGSVRQRDGAVEGDPILGSLRRFWDVGAMLLEEGIPVFSRPAKALLRIPAASRGIDAVEFVVASSGLAASAPAICECAIACVAILVGVMWLATGSLSFSIIAAAAACWLALSAAVNRHEIAREAVAELLPDALNAIGVYYESGLSLMQAFEQASLETPGALGEKLGRVASDMKAGASAEEALGHLHKSSDTKSMAFVAVALEVQQRTGGALKPLLTHAAENVSDALEMKRFLEVKTSQSRLSAKIVSIMPVMLFLLMGAIDSGYIDEFFGSSTGIGLFLTAVVLEILGIAAVRRILGLNTGEV